MTRQKVSKISELTPCFVTLPLAPSASSSILILTQLFSFSQPSTNEYISVAAPAEESPITYSLGVFGNSQPNKWPQISLLGQRSLLKIKVKSIASEPIVTETASEGFVILLQSRRSLRSQASRGYMPAQSFGSTQILLFLKTPCFATAQHTDLPAMHFHMGAPTFVLRAILFQQQT